MDIVDPSVASRRLREEDRRPLLTSRTVCSISASCPELYTGGSRTPSLVFPSPSLSKNGSIGTRAISRISN